MFVLVIFAIGFFLPGIFLHHGWFSGLNEFNEIGSNLVGPQNVLRAGIREGVSGHLVPERISWVLHNGDATALLDGIEPGGAVVLQTTEHDSNDARTVLAGRGAK